MITALMLLVAFVSVLIFISVLYKKPWLPVYTICGVLLIWHFVRPSWMPTVWPPFYWAWPIRAQVVDAQTLQPLEGVRVTATWKLEGGWHPVTKEFVEMETFTDSEGRFLVCWLLPRLRWPLDFHIDDSDPEFRFYKRGYGESWRRNSNGWIRYGIIRWSDWHGKRIPLKKQTAKKGQATGQQSDLSRFSRSEAARKRVKQLTAI